MVKAIFAIFIFFFFISVLFYGIRFILVGLSSLFHNNEKQLIYPIYDERTELKTIPASATVTHQLSYYDPVMDEQIIESGDTVKCYSEYGSLWVKFKPQSSEAIKTIKVKHITEVKNLKTGESKTKRQEIVDYFDRFV